MAAVRPVFNIFGAFFINSFMMSLSLRARAGGGYSSIIYSDAHVSGMERAVITIHVVHVRSSSQLLITYQIQSHCIKLHQSYG